MLSLRHPLSLMTIYDKVWGMYVASLQCSVANDQKQETLLVICERILVILPILTTLEGKCPLASQFGLFFMESPTLYFKIYSIVTLLIYENCYSDCTSWTTAQILLLKTERKKVVNYYAIMNIGTFYTTCKCQLKCHNHDVCKVVYIFSTTQLMMNNNFIQSQERQPAPENVNCNCYTNFCWSMQEKLCQHARKNCQHAS